VKNLSHICWYVTAFLSKICFISKEYCFLNYSHIPRVRWMWEHDIQWYFVDGGH